MRKPTLAPNAADFNQLKISVEKLKSMNITTFYPGHGKPIKANEPGW